MTRIEKIASLYTAVTGDANPTAEELNEYAGLNPSVSLEAISATLTSQSPIAFDAMPSSNLIDYMFINLFGYTQVEIDALRATEEGAAGFAYWVNELDNNPAINVNTIAIALLNGAEAAGAGDEERAINKSADLVAAYNEEYGSEVGSEFMLTVNQDDLSGTTGADTFKAYIFDNQNTAQSGDMIDGKAGNDRLEADIGNSQNFAITLHTDSVDQFAVRAQDDNSGDDSSDNNMANNVQIDAERMVSTDWYESNNSRADVVIEDVRIERKDAYNDEDDQITQNITVAMVSTDPGDVDLDVYFDQASLVKEGDATANSITLSVSNQVEEEVFDSSKPLENIPYTEVIFLVNGEEVRLELNLIAVETYDQMWAAMQTAFASEQAVNPLLTNVTMSRTVDTAEFTSKDGVDRVADEYILTIDGGRIEPAETGWNAEGGLPSTNAFGANVEVGDMTTTSNLITSTVVLDNVGRGSMGGDLVIGGLSVGSTSDSKGVEQFNISVDRNSELQNITSTNNTLEEVYVVNKDHFEDNNITATGSLTVTGTVDGVNNDDVDGGANTIDGYGFNDVRVFDASAMVGSVNINAVLSENVVSKYMNLGDTANDGSADNAQFLYKLGENDDVLSLDISEANLAAAGTTTREDFALSIKGNAGNDTITTKIEDGSGIDADNWYKNSVDNANLSVSTGSGNDTVNSKGAGNWTIDTGSGNDTVYADNTGEKAKWLVGAENVDIADLDAQTTADMTNQFLVDGKLTVTLLSPDSTVDDAAAYTEGYEVTVDIPTAANYTVTQLHINQAIKDAINNDSVLNKLLVAKDGPADVLVIESLIDGVMNKDDLEITVASADLSNDFTPAQENMILTKYQNFANNSAAVFADAETASETTALAAINAVNGIGTDGAVLAQDTGADITGSDSASASDNIINAGSGDDVIVLGTTGAVSAESNDTVVFEGNFGRDTIVNFVVEDTSTPTNGDDDIDFTSYLTSQVSASGSSTTAQYQTIAVEGDLANITANDVVQTDVTTVNGITATVDTFATIDSAKMLEALNADGTFAVDVTANFYGTAGAKAVIMVENNANEGEYKVFDVTYTEPTANDDTDNFTSATLVGIIDFGETTNLTTADLTPHV
ncbi:MAG: hypothetical protein CSA86_02620 [Arcobacter sp.]|nr:MAG: hypothetical protein CSA86_02620 [Arcobacter sp.]